MAHLKDNPFTPARKEAAKLRLALTGASGSGKTWTALLIAERICELEGGKIAFLDTEGRSARKYADRFSFDVYDLSHDYRPQRYIIGIQAAAQFGYTVVVVDSLSHAWMGLGGVLDIVDTAAQKMGGNSFAGWSKGRPAQNNLVDAIINADIHVLGTMRSKTEWILETDPKTGKTKPVKKGLAAVQSSDFEYEFDVVIRLDMAHMMTVSKSRCHSLQAESEYDNAVDVGTALHNWLADGEIIQHEPEANVIAFVSPNSSDPPPDDTPPPASNNGPVPDDKPKVKAKSKAPEKKVSAQAVRENQVFDQLQALFSNRDGFNGYLDEYGPDNADTAWTWKQTATQIAVAIFLHRCELVYKYGTGTVYTILEAKTLKAYFKDDDSRTFDHAWQAIQDYTPPPATASQRAKEAWDILVDEERQRDVPGRDWFIKRALDILRVMDTTPAPVLANNVLLQYAEEKQVAALKAASG